ALLSPNTSVLGLDRPSRHERPNAGAVWTRERPLSTPAGELGSVRGEQAQPRLLVKHVEMARIEGQLDAVTRSDAAPRREARDERRAIDRDGDQCLGAE